MINITLSPIPNQSFSIRLNNQEFNLRFHTCKNITTADIAIDNLIIQTGIRIVSFYPLINYRYLESGNFILLTNNGDYPYYPEFNVSQFLYYLSPQELEDLRAST